MRHERIRIISFIEFTQVVYAMVSCHCEGRRESEGRVGYATIQHFAATRTLPEAEMAHDLNLSIVMKMFRAIGVNLIEPLP